MLEVVAYHMHRFFGEPGGWWGFFPRFLPTLLFLVLIGVGIWAVIRVTARERAPIPIAAPFPAAAPRDSALEEVRLLYAKGDISREEFVQRSRDLGGTVPESGEPSPPAAG